MIFALQLLCNLSKSSLAIHFIIDRYCCEIGKMQVCHYNFALYWKHLMDFVIPIQFYTQNIWMSSYNVRALFRHINTMTQDCLTLHAWVIQDKILIPELSGVWACLLFSFSDLGQSYISINNVLRIARIYASGFESNWRAQLLWYCLIPLIAQNLSQLKAPKINNSKKCYKIKETRQAP